MGLTDTDEEILVHLLMVGGDGPQGIANRIGANPDYVSQRLSVLSDRHLVTKSDSGVYRLSYPEGIETARGIYRTEW